jgi:hypothetical protein
MLKNQPVVCSLRYLIVGEINSIRSLTLRLSRARNPQRSGG